ncbi:MAG: RNA 2',3'-cyclic phosphodiesterase [Janthinobacterium lividum]
MRLFVAIDLPRSLRQRLAGLYGSLPGALWVAPENIHLTLRFIGETRPDVADEIDHALRSLRGRRFDLALQQTGMFTRAGPRGTATLCAGVARNEPLDHLRCKIENALQRVGIAPERRRFQPHVSLARVDQVPEPVLAGWMQAHNLLRTDSVVIDSFTLFSSQPGPDRPVYTAEVDYELV